MDELLTALFLTTTIPRLDGLYPIPQCTNFSVTLASTLWVVNKVRHFLFLENTLEEAFPTAIEFLLIGMLYRLYLSKATFFCDFYYYWAP